MAGCPPGYVPVWITLLLTSNFHVNNNFWVFCFSKTFRKPIKMRTFNGNTFVIPSRPPEHIIGKQMCVSLWIQNILIATYSDGKITHLNVINQKVKMRDILNYL